MKKYFYSTMFISSILFTSCSTDSKCQEQIQIKYPNSTVFSIPNIYGTYIVTDTTGAVYYIETKYSFSSKISSTVLIKASK